MAIVFKHKGNFKRTEKFLRKVKNKDEFKILSKYGEEGVMALASATPVDSGLTADSWRYEIPEDDRGIALTWYNENDANGWFNVAIGLQYGHGTINGGWVEGIDYINPALKPIFQKMADAVWAEIVNM